MDPRRPLRRGRLAGICALALIPAGIAAAPTTGPTPPIDRIDEILRVEAAVPAPTLRIDGADAGAAEPDVARALARLPGVDVNGNGPLTGLLQIRGLYGPRTTVRLDGLTMISGGPNWMDPPLHYVPAGLLHTATVAAGVPSQSAGGAFGGNVEAALRRPEFAADAAGGWQPWLDLDAGVHSVDDGWSTAAVAGIASARHRIHLAVSREAGDDRESGGGALVPTAYERRGEGVGYGLRTDRLELDASYRRVRSDDAGTPVLPLDVEFFDTDLWHVDARLNTDWGALTAFVGGLDIQHAMNNTALRTTPDFSALPLPPFAGDDARRVRASADGTELRLGAEVDLPRGVLRGGVGWREESHDARVSDPDFTPFFVTNFDDARAEYRTAWAEWGHRLDARTRLDLGARVTRTETDADPVDAFPARLVDANPAMWPMGTPPRAVFVLRERFNAADRSRSDTEFDWDVRLTRRLGDAVAVEAGLARRTRVPAYMERYLWIPLEVNGGLGDGNAYVGDPDLDPEISHQGEFGLTWVGDRARASVRAHYRHIDDYIQGVAEADPVTVAVAAGASGDATPLRFANVEARLWGVDAEGELRLTDRLVLDATAAWLDGERRDVDDGLFRIAPPNLVLGLAWSDGPFEARLSQQLVMRQDAGSRTLTLDPGNPSNAFEDVPGHGLTHLDASWTPTVSLRLALGVRNLFDRDFVDPLAGFNRTPDGAAPIGERLPGDGRNVYARARWTLR